MRYHKFIVTLVFIAICFAAGSQTVKGRLLYSDPSQRNKIPAKEMMVMLAPQTPVNERTMAGNLFQWNNAQLIKNMNALITTTNDDGFYYFSNISPGKYIMRVCKPSGIIYRFEMKAAKNQYFLIPDLRAVR